MPRLTPNATPPRRKRNNRFQCCRYLSGEVVHEVNLPQSTIRRTVAGLLLKSSRPAEESHVADCPILPTGRKQFNRRHVLPTQAAPQWFFFGMRFVLGGKECRVVDEPFTNAGALGLVKRALDAPKSPQDRRAHFSTEERGESSSGKLIRTILSTGMPVAPTRVAAA